MRVTETRLLELAASSMDKGYRQLSRAQDQLTSGIRVDRPSTDATAWAKGRRVEARQIASTGRENVIARAREKLSIGDGAMDSLGKILSRARELAVQAGNATLGGGERSQLALEVRALANTALGELNVQGVDGEYLFAGTLGNIAPFDAGGNYVGDAGQRSVEAYERSSQLATLPGSRFTASSGVDILGALDQLATAMEANDVVGVTGTLGSLDTSIEQAAQARTELWTYSDALNAADDTRATLDITLAEIHAGAVETDIVGAATELSQASRSIEAAQAMTARLMEIL